MTKSITQKFIYEDNFTKADVIELYCKRIVNATPFNRLFVKEISWYSNHERKKYPDESSDSQYIGGYISPLVGYVAVQLFTSKKPYKCEMSRQLLFSKNERKIKLENIDNKLEVEVTGRPGSVKRVKKVLDQLFTIDPEEQAMNERIADYLIKD